MVNLELYKVFYTVAKCGSLTKAAQELYISQPAVSQSIKQLESALGVTLFNRTHRGMELSASGGKIIFKQVEEALSLIENAERSIEDLKTTPTGTIRVGATDSIFAHIIADKLAAFNAQYPAVKFELISSTSPDTITKLKDGGCDIAFVNLPIDDEEVKLIGTVCCLSDIFVAGDNYSFLKGQTLSFKKLQEYPLLMIEQNTIARRSMDSFLSSLGEQLTPDIEVANWDFMLKLAVKGMGIGCIPREYCTEELKSGQLFEVATNPALPVRGVGIALTQNANASYALRQFIKMFQTA